MSDNPNGFNHCFNFEYYPLSNSGNSYFPPNLHLHQEKKAWLESTVVVMSLAYIRYA